MITPHELMGLVGIALTHGPTILAMALASLVTGATMRARRNYSAEYRRRRTKHPELTARQAAGHPGPADVLPSAEAFFVRLPDGRPGTLYGARVSRQDIRRVGRYLALVALVSENRIDPKVFRRRVHLWRPIAVLGPAEITGTYRFLDDPEVAVLLADRERTAERETWVDSGRRRPTQRRRTR